MKPRKRDTDLAIFISLPQIMLPIRPFDSPPPRPPICPIEEAISHIMYEPTSPHGLGPDIVKSMGVYGRERPSSRTSSVYSSNEESDGKSASGHDPEHAAECMKDSDASLSRKNCVNSQDPDARKKAAECEWCCAQRLEATGLCHYHTFVYGWEEQRERKKQAEILARRKKGRPDGGKLAPISTPSRSTIIKVHYGKLEVVSRKLKTNEKGSHHDPEKQEWV